METTTADLNYQFDGTYDTAGLATVFVGTTPSGTECFIHPEQCRNAAEQRHLVALGQRLLARAKARREAYRARTQAKARALAPKHGPTFTLKGDNIRFRNLTAGMATYFGETANSLLDHDPAQGRTWVEFPVSEMSFLLGSLEGIEGDIKEGSYLGLDESHGRRFNELAESNALQCLNRCYDLAGLAWTAAERFRKA